MAHDPRFAEVAGPAPGPGRVLETGAHGGPASAPDEDALYFTSLRGRGTTRCRAHRGWPSGALARDGRRFPLESERLTTIREDANAANGMTLDRWRRLRLDSPNDVVVAGDGRFGSPTPAYGATSRGSVLATAAPTRSPAATTPRPHRILTLDVIDRRRLSARACTRWWRRASRRPRGGRPGPVDSSFAGGILALGREGDLLGTMPCLPLRAWGIVSGSPSSQRRPLWRPCGGEGPRTSP